MLALVTSLSQVINPYQIYENHYISFCNLRHNLSHLGMECLPKNHNK